MGASANYDEDDDDDDKRADKSQILPNDGCGFFCDARLRSDNN